MNFSEFFSHGGTESTEEREGRRGAHAEARRTKRGRRGFYLIVANFCYLVFNIMMKNSKKIIACGALLVVLLVSACDDWVISDYNKFDYNLQGTWVQNEPGNYTGELIIDYDSITIYGYFDNQTPWWGNDDERPFKGFTKGVALKGYSEEGSIYIEDRGSLQEGISYTYYTGKNTAD
jgi:hypothetical protein